MTAAIVAVERGSACWPSALADLGPHAPERLWVRGTMPGSDTAAVAIVGPRRATAAGLATARRIAADLAGLGIAVISGFARGVDSAAHAASAAGGGITVAVCGCGIDVDYPRGNRSLGDVIVAAGGALVSEFEPGTHPLAGHFPQRNRIIAALARAVIVVEAGDRSGALSTARWAADLGRDVLPVPGPLHSPVSRGTNRLIRDGARPYLEIDDILEVLGLGRLALGVSARPPRRAGRRHTDAIVGLVSGGPTHPEEIADRLGLEAPRLAVRLAELEIAGVIRRLPGGLVEAVAGGPA